jgi:hypothetical protein
MRISTVRIKYSFLGRTVFFAVNLNQELGPVWWFGPSEDDVFWSRDT